MHRFKVGQKVVAIRNHSQGRYKKGDILTVESLTCCQKCGIPCLVLKEIKIIKNAECVDGCRFFTSNVRISYTERSFAPLQNNADAVEYKLKVSIPELTEIKELQNQ